LIDVVELQSRPKKSLLLFIRRRRPCHQILCIFRELAAAFIVPRAILQQKLLQFNWEFAVHMTIRVGSGGGLEILI